MKRKRSQDLAAANPQKRSAKPAATESSTNPCRLLHILSQYGLLEVIASHLLSDDLLALSLTSKTIRSAIFPNEESRDTLLKKMACDGRGVRIRASQHRKSSFFFQYNCSEYVKCASHDPGRKVESRPCAKCRARTCDECRIHCIYQSIYEAPKDPEDLANFSGFALLSSSEMGILSPHHLDASDQTERWQDPCANKSQPYHDQGFLDLPLECAAHAPPESIDDILGLDLGSRTMELSLSSHVPRPSPVIQAFWQVTEQRKRWFCEPCFVSEQKRHHPQSTATPKCHCTLKKRFLERWLCLRCYETELALTDKYPRGAKSCGASPPQCSCGHSLDLQSHVLCLWCLGEVSTPHGTIRNRLEDSGVGSSPE